MYVLNAAAITKPHAIEHLSADLTGYNADIAVITETHPKKKHADHNFTVNDYTLFRLNSTQLNRELRTQVSDTSKSAS